MALETGSVIGIRSLGGVVSNAVQGRQSLSYGGWADTAILPVLSSNPRRISALIQFWSDPLNTSTLLTVLLGDQAVCQLVQGGSFQIDANYPWTGDVRVQADVGTCYVVANEVTIL